MTTTILLLAGDGIGPEVVAQARRVAEILVPDLAFEEALVGGIAYDQEGDAISDETLARAKASDAVLLGAVGGAQWADVPRDKRPEMGLLRLRKELDVFANLRPAYCFAPLVDASSLKRDLIEDLDLMFVRELTSGVYLESLAGSKRWRVVNGLVMRHRAILLRRFNGSHVWRLRLRVGGAAEWRRLKNRTSWRAVCSGGRKSLPCTSVKARASS